MVKIAYEAVYRPRSVLFENLATVEVIPAQPVLLLDSEGIPIRALYVMEKQFVKRSYPEGNRTWRINGCYLVAITAE
ncbi:DUF4864 domain-containing protein [Microcoleus sp. CAWBG58]|uniref:DUF4864 domain-containing protein n=1 Tax=Microcoleus sp. CAWBG58 TaxID=2841651 RepID=UPI0025D04E86|nr:DUF4864 domain-containing protein [Microcoleus sp. CAWBG58]